MGAGARLRALASVTPNAAVTAISTTPPNTRIANPASVAGAHYRHAIEVT
jgi:hypothetical protein